MATDIPPNLRTGVCDQCGFRGILIRRPVMPPRSAEVFHEEIADIPKYVPIEVKDLCLTCSDTPPGEKSRNQ